MADMLSQQEVDALLGAFDKGEGEGVVPGAVSKSSLVTDKKVTYRKHQ